MTAVECQRLRTWGEVLVGYRGVFLEDLSNKQEKPFVTRVEPLGW